MMRTLIAGMLKRSALAAHNLVSQVVVSVTAAICVAIISNTYFEKAPAPVKRQVAAAPAVEAQPQPATSSLAPVEVAPEPQMTARMPVARPALPKPQPIRVASLPKPTEAAPVATPPISYGTEIFSEHAGAAPALYLDGSVEPSAPKRLLGLPLPRFVPTYGGLAESVEGARAKFGTLLDDIRD